MRSIKTTTVAWGIVTAPVKLYAATDDNHGLKAHQHHAADFGGIRYKRVCDVCDQEVEFRDIVRGYEHAGGPDVIVTDEDIAALDVEQDGAGIEILSFIHDDSVPPFTDSVYYLGVDDNKGKNKGAHKSYALLYRVLTESHRVAVVRFALRQRTRLGVLRVIGDVLAIQVLVWHDEIRPTDKLPGAWRTVELSPQEIKVAHMLLDSMSEDQFEPAQYRDEYADRLSELIQAKADGGQFDVSAPADQVDDVSDLLARLEQSIERRELEKVS